MRLDELFGLFGPSDKDKAKEKEMKQLAIKSKGMYTKSIDNFEKVMDQNAEAFDAQPLKAFNQWFEHIFDKTVDRMIKTKSITINDSNISQMAKPVIALASINYYLKPKTPFAGFQMLVQLSKTIDPNIKQTVDKTFGKFVEKGSGNPTDVNAKPKTGTTYDTGENGKFTWVGAMWVDDQQQPAPKDVQGILTQKARDEGKTQ